MPRAGLPRAPRLAVRAPVDVRVATGGPWIHGWTVNISQSGVLLALPDPADLGGDVEFIIRLSDGVWASTAGAGVLPDLHGRGQVVRAVSSPAGMAFAAANIRTQEVRPRTSGAESPGRRTAR